MTATKLYAVRVLPGHVLWTEAGETRYCGDLLAVSLEDGLELERRGVAVLWEDPQNPPTVIPPPRTQPTRTKNG